MSSDPIGDGTPQAAAGDAEPGRVADDHDSPWTEVLDPLFPKFLAFFFPAVLAALDLSRGFEGWPPRQRGSMRDRLSAGAPE